MASAHDGEAEVTDLEVEYELLGELGRGGSAIVYRARDRVLGREVAIKVVRARFGSDDEAIARLAREARTVAQLQHPHIVTVHAVKHLRDGGLALVMQLVPGRTLKAAIVEDGPMPPAQVERVVRDVAHALAYAHQHGVVHRDVKPENIFIEESTGRAMLSDFGIAHSSEFDSRLTMTGTAIGTPAYMSPEQIDGAPADARSDVYSLGLVAWEMLTGERPWDGETLYNVIFKQKHEELPAIDEMRAGVPLRLQYIVERMLQKHPAARWAGADGMLGFMNASVLPSDWRQWEDAHRRRKARAKARAQAESTAKTGLVAAALATIRFRRPSADEVAAGALATPPASTHAARAAAPSAPAVDDARPSWAREAPAPRRSRRAIAVGALLAVAASSGVLLYAQRERTAEARTVSAPSLADRGAVEVPVAPPVDTSRSQGFDSAASDASDSAAVAAELARLAAYDSAYARPLNPAATAPLAAPLVAPLVAPLAAPLPAPARPLSSPPVVTASSAGELARNSSMPVPPPPAAAGAGGGTTAGATPGYAPMTSTSSTAAPASMVVVRPTDERGIIAAGGRHSCALSGTRVLCWGGNERGQLGDGELETRDAPAPIVGDLDFVQVSAGIAHSCGVTRSGDAYCWGSDERGQLGDATTSSRSAPVRVAGVHWFRLVRAGRDHSCGLTSSGEIACWGANSEGQLGDGGTTSRSAPITVSGARRFIALSAGWRHTCAIATDGMAYCWGDNSAGQLGDGSRAAHTSPTPVSSTVRFTSIAAGSSHTCAVSEGGDAYCWGRNNYGQLGVGGSIDRTAPTKVNTTARFTSVSAGSVHTCARSGGGGVWCWGGNAYGQLGDGSNVHRDVPVRVTGGGSYVAMSATGAHTCAVASDGETSCWGYNVDGQLGDGTRNHRARPARVTIPAGRE